MKPGDLVKRRLEWLENEGRDAGLYGLVLEKANTRTPWPTWWVYFHPDRMILHEEDLELVND
jgi:hypothetical protein